MSRSSTLLLLTAANRKRSVVRASEALARMASLTQSEKGLERVAVLKGEPFCGVAAIRKCKSGFAGEVAQRYVTTAPAWHS